MQDLSDEQILNIIRKCPHGLSSRDISNELGSNVSRHLLRDRLNKLIHGGQLYKKGVRRWVRYFAVQSDSPQSEQPAHQEKTLESQTWSAKQVKMYIEKPLSERPAIGYNFDFLDDYQTKTKFYLSESELQNLHDMGAREHPTAPAGTYVNRIYDKLLIDLTWNSSRLEGNTYTPVEIERLIEFHKESSDKQREETQMVLNHMEAIRFLVKDVETIAVDRLTIFRLHALLSQELIVNPRAVGSLREIGVKIGESSYTPLDTPLKIVECFDRILAKASGITDPFEQAFFLMVHLPYLQPFEDVNKRTSRLALNIPLIKKNMVPLSFIGMNKHCYIQAILGVYELNNINLLKDLFIWSYERSVESYKRAVSQVETPDKFRQAYKQELTELIASMVRGKVPREQALNWIDQWATGRISPNDVKNFKLHAERNLINLKRETAIIYRLTDAEFTAWREIWGDV